VYSLAVYNGELVAAGRITTRGGVSVNSIASGTHLLVRARNGFSQTEAPYAEVDLLTVFNNELFAGGPVRTKQKASKSIYRRWNGSVWSPLGRGLICPRSIFGFNGELLVSGASTMVSGLLIGSLCALGTSVATGYGRGSCR